MIPISIDVSGVANEFRLSREEIDELKRTLVTSLTSALYEQWGLAAGKNLKSSRNRYQRGLVIVDEGRFKGSVMLTGTVPNMIESGASAFDMKVGFSKSQKIKRGKDGNWYLTVPFRLATPGAGGESEVFAGVVPTSVYELVKQQPIGITSSGRKASKGLSLNQIPKEFQAPKTRPAVSVGERKFKEYKNKTSIYAGLSRTVDSAGKSQVMGFRRVSSKSDPGSWIHTGIKARKLAEMAIKNMQVDVRVDRIIDDFLSKRR